MNRFRSVTLWVLRVVVLAAALTGTGWLLADDDEGKHEEHEERERHRSHRGSGSKALPALDHPAWKEECSSCHMLYHPGLLPERSWRAMMAGLDKHFEENASLEAKVRDEITAFLVANSADHSSARRSQKIAQSLPAGSAPQRISEIPYIKRKHHEIKASVYKRPAVKSRANCVACHKDAEKGEYDEDTVRIPRASQKP